MHPLLTVVVAVLCAWAVRRKNGVAPQGMWALLTAVVAVLLLYSDIFLVLFGKGVALQYDHGLTWSLFFLPAWACVASFGVHAVALHRYKKRITWQSLFPTALVSLAVAWFLAALTAEGVQPFSPLWDGRLALSLLYRFDFIILGLACLSLVLGFIFRLWQRDIGRLGLLCILIYLIALMTFQWKAENTAENYAEALRLKEPVVHTLPQPLSPFNWRLIVVEKNGRVHDTMVNLNREAPLTVPEGATRAYRIQALYKPVNKAVWRIYRRYGRRGMGKTQQAVIHNAWQALKHSPFYWHSRFAVFAMFTDPPMNNCMLFRDLRSEGARKDDRGSFLVCQDAQQEGKQKMYHLFQQDGEKFERLTTLF